MEIVDIAIPQMLMTKWSHLAVRTVISRVMHFNLSYTLGREGESLEGENKKLCQYL